MFRVLTLLALWGFQVYPSAGQPRLTPLAHLPDPYVVRFQDQWFLFGTGKTPSFYYGDRLAVTALKREQLDLLYTDPAVKPAKGVWGFIPYRHTDGSWHGYATLHYGDYRVVIAHFLPETGADWTRGKPITSWRFDKVVIGDLAAGKDTAYESKLITDETGALYLVYCDSGARARNVRIFAQRMSSPGSVDPSWSPRVLLSPDGYRSEDRNPGYIQIVEGPNIFRLGTRYALLYSVGDFALNNYKLGVAYSKTLIPPPGQTYQKVLIPDPNNVWKNTGKTNEVCYLLQSEQPDWPNYCRPLFSGPGLGNLLTVDSHHFLLFHAYKPDDNVRQSSNRYVWMLPVNANADERLPMEKWICPLLGPKGKT